MKKTILYFFFLCIALPAMADEAKEKIYCQQILNQLDAIQPLIVAASHEQPANMRVKFHYTRFQDNAGHWHNGLLEDVQAIRSGVEEKLNQVSLEPRVVSPLKSDYLDKPLKENVVASSKGVGP